MLSVVEISSVWLVALCLSFPELCSSYRATPTFAGRYRLRMSTSISDAKVEISASTKTLKVVEFFSGIGGWAKAFESQKNSNFNVVAAYDVNSVSNEVYKHVFGKNPCSSAIESLSLKTLEALDADIWVRETLP
jgi:C-5 cytosine-specific DNA methylase